MKIPHWHLNAGITGYLIWESSTVEERFADYCEKWSSKLFAEIKNLVAVGWSIILDHICFED